MIYGKKFSKYNQESAWTTRPLRRGQLHYAALDAVSVLDILKKYRASDGANVEEVYFRPNFSKFNHVLESWRKLRPWQRREENEQEEQGGLHPKRRAT